MKKLFRTLFIIILFVGVGFLYVVKNPSLPISQKVLTTLGIQVTPTVTSQQATTGIDLTNCVAYFDGCNNCSVKDGKADACTLMYCETPTAPKCLQYATGTATPSTTENTNPAGLANPASVNCETKGGTLAIVTQSDGGQIGMCTLADGTVCEERAYMRGECGVPNQGTMCTMEYMPVCASVQIECIKAPCYPIEETFSNLCMMHANKLATFLHNGECTAK